jgi:hypothetical protein
MQLAPIKLWFSYLQGNDSKELENANDEPTSVCKRLRIEQMSVRPTSMLDRDNREACRHILTRLMIR